MNPADHLMIAPVVLPLFVGAMMLALDGERHRNINAALNVVSTFVLVGISIALLRAADASPSGVAGVYRLGDWPAPFAIVFVVDRPATMMLLLTSVLAAAAVVFSLARWHRVGVLFHPLFQFLLMGINGAFLTGDLFNLFVFFKVLLAASYGFAARLGFRAGDGRLHYIVVNLVASLLFLIGVSLIYGVAGTLNMADLAARIPAIPPRIARCWKQERGSWVLRSLSRRECGPCASGSPAPMPPHHLRWHRSSRSSRR